MAVKGPRGAQERSGADRLTKRWDPLRGSAVREELAAKGETVSVFGGAVERGWGEGLHSVGRGALRAQGLRMSSAECPALSGTAGALPAS